VVRAKAIPLARAKVESKKVSRRMFVVGLERTGWALGLGARTRVPPVALARGRDAPMIEDRGPGAL
jgi:hypothetical protein